MSVEDLQSTLDTLRTVELRRTFRGVDPEQARKLLDQAADSLEAAKSQQEKLGKELDQLRAASKDEEDEIAQALITAVRASETLVAEARQAAASLIADAEAQASALLEQVAALAEQREQEVAAAREEFERELSEAKADLAEEHRVARAGAEAALAEARQELARLENEAARVRASVEETKQHALEIAQTALNELEDLGAATSSGEGVDLLGDLRPSGTPADVAAD